MTALRRRSRGSVVRGDQGFQLGAAVHELCACLDRPSFPNEVTEEQPDQRGGCGENGANWFASHRKILSEAHTTSWYFPLAEIACALEAEELRQGLLEELNCRRVRSGRVGVQNVRARRRSTHCVGSVGDATNCHIAPCNAADGEAA